MGERLDIVQTTDRDPLEALRIPTQDLDKLLRRMARFGRPRVSLLMNGWHASCEMNTNAQGASFKIESEFRMESPVIAAQQLQERIYAALKDIRTAVADD